MKRQSHGNLMMAFFFVCLFAGFSGQADIRVWETSDRVHLDDGTVLECVVVCEGARSVIVIVNDEEQTISRERILRIARQMPDSGTRRAGFETEMVDGHEVVVARGYRDNDMEPKRDMRPKAANPVDAITKNILGGKQGNNKAASDTAMRAIPRDVEKLLKGMQGQDGGVPDDLQRMLGNRMIESMADEYGGVEGLMRAFQSRKDKK